MNETFNLKPTEGRAFGHRPVVHHGSIRGYAAHVELDQDPCYACYTARRDYDKARYATPSVKAKAAIRGEAYSRAISRLSRMHPAIFQALYAEELEYVQDERGVDL